MKQSFTRYFGNEYDIPPGMTKVSCRGVAGGSVTLWGTAVIGFVGTSHIKAPDCQVLARLIVDTPYGPTQIWTGNHTGEPAMGFGLSWQPPLVSTAECWLEYDLWNPTNTPQGKAYEFQVNIYTQAAKAPARSKKGPGIPSDNPAPPSQE